MPTAVPVSSRRLPAPAIVIAAALGVLTAATGALWAYYGTAVFYEMILTGIAACF
ncbi:MAG: hypothetical protein WD073_01560 [Xanthobacteraceae bacterium]